MSSSSIPVYKCDRCGHEEELRETSMLYPWGILFARNVNGPFHVGNETYSDGKIKGVDLCPTCVGTLKSWWLIGKDARP